MNPQFPTQENTESNPEADAAALQAIQALEAEAPSPNVEAEASRSTIYNEANAADATSPPSIQPAEIPTSVQQVEMPAPVLPVAPAVSVSSTPFSTFGSNGGVDAPVASPPAEALTQEAVPVDTASTGSIGKKKKSKKALIITLVLIVVLAGGSVAGYYAWQSLSPKSSTVTDVEPQSGGNQQSDTTQNQSATPTQESVNSEASAIESDLKSVDTNELNDATLNNATLFQD